MMIEQLVFRSAPVRFPRQPGKIRQVKYPDFDLSVWAAELTHLSPFPICLLLMLPDLIGTHEAIDGHSGQNPDFVRGWNGSPIAIAAAESDRIFDQLGEGVHVIESGLEYGQFGVLDGHHRRAKSEAMGLRRIPAQLFPLRCADIVIGTWDPSQPLLSKNDVVACFADPNLVFDLKATRFQVRGTDGTLRRIKDYQPRLAIESASLR